VRKYAEFGRKKYEKHAVFPTIFVLTTNDFYFNDNLDNLDNIYQAFLRPSGYKRPKVERPLAIARTMTAARQQFYNPRILESLEKPQQILSPPSP
jgi:hypothetical protein